jgi:hypothetical protein|tara:strand:+ start:177 stop:311 length:135 start_codon:yes stop_codon:yes gene_type:complete
MMMRYFFGAGILCGIGYLEGDILIAALCMGIAYGFIDFMRERSI